MLPKLGVLPEFGADWCCPKFPDDGAGGGLAGEAEYALEPAELSPPPPNLAAMRAFASSRSLV